MSETLPGVKVADFYTGVTAATMSKGARPVKGENQRSLKFYTLVEFLMILRHRWRYASYSGEGLACFKAFKDFGFVTRSGDAPNLQTFAFTAPGMEIRIAKSNTPPGGKRGGARQCWSFICKKA
jgi:hypothetical protein